MKQRVLVSLGAVALVVLAACNSGGGGSAGPSATLDIHAGVVEVSTDDVTFTAATDGQALTEGTTIRTGADGRAAIAYFDGSVTRLDHSTTFKIVTLQILDNDEQSKVIEGEQTSGNTYNRVTELTDSASRFEIETPTATASVQGTVYAVLINPDGSSVIAVLEGSVTSDGVEIPEGTYVTVDEDGNVSEPQPIPEDLIDDEWIVYNCEVDDGPECPDDASTTTTTVAGPDEPPTTLAETTTTTVAETTTTTAAPTTTTAAVTTTTAATTTTTTLPPDETAPVVTITDAPANPSADDFADFEFSSDDAGEGFECSIDEGPFEDCPQPPQDSRIGATGSAYYDDLADGPHLFAVRVSDAAGNIGLETFLWTVDTRPPTVGLDRSPSDPSGDSAADFAFSADEFDVSFLCSLDGETPTGCPAFLNTFLGGGPETFGSAYYEGPLADGNHTFQVYATDVAGNQGSLPELFEWEVDATAPTIGFDDTPADPSDEDTAYFSFHVDEFDVTFLCSLDGALADDCPDGLQGFLGGPISQGSAFYDELEDGDHTFTVYAFDFTGNPGTASFSWTIDTVSEVAHIEIYPSDSTIDLGDSQNYTGAAFAANGQQIPGIDEDNFVFTIDNGSCEGATCTPTDTGEWTVTATHGVFTARAILTVLGSGEVQVTLDWETTADLDLYVTEPDAECNDPEGGEEVYYGNTNSACGGQLDRDANYPCGGGQQPPENVFWETAPDGQYAIRVHRWSPCDDPGDISYHLTVQIDGIPVLDVVGVLNDQNVDDFYNFTKGGE